MVKLKEIEMKYPGAGARQMGDSPELASELANLIKKESKRPLVDLLPLTNRKNLLRGLAAIT